MPRASLNDKTQAIYDFLVRCVDERGYPPTIREIGEEFGIRSTNGVRHHLSVLEREGYLRRGRKISRGLEPLAPGSPAPRGLIAASTGIPILGRVAAGSPLLAEENVEGHLSLDELFPPREELFALRVRGLSMRDRGILDGDVVVVRRQEHARDGDMVVALVGDDATVKSYRRTAAGIELEPANPDFEALRVGPDDDFRLLGVVVGLVRPPDARRA